MGNQLNMFGVWVGGWVFKVTSASKQTSSTALSNSTSAGNGRCVPRVLLTGQVESDVNTIGAFNDVPHLDLLKVAASKSTTRLGHRCATPRPAQLGCCPLETSMSKIQLLQLLLWVLCRHKAPCSRQLMTKVETWQLAYLCTALTQSNQQSHAARQIPALRVG